MQQPLCHEDPLGSALKAIGLGHQNTLALRNAWDRFTLLDGQFLQLCRQQIGSPTWPSFLDHWLTSLKTSTPSNILWQAPLSSSIDRPLFLQSERETHHRILSATLLLVTKRAWSSLQNRQPIDDSWRNLMVNEIKNSSGNYFDNPPFGYAFLCNLVKAIVGLEPKKEYATQILFPVIRGNEGVLVWMILERVSEGNGELFINPQQAFLFMDGSFRSQLLCVPNQVARCFTKLPFRNNVRIRLETYNPANISKLVALRGCSAGGALALALYSLWTGIPIEKDIVVSFRLSSDPSDSSKALCLPVVGDVSKLLEVKRHGLRRLMVAEDQVENLKQQANTIDIELLAASRLSDAVDIATGRLRCAKKFLEKLRGSLNLLPVYYPQKTLLVLDTKRN